ncbi:hypothetical protein BH11PLA2_BH11PLA2_11430 [soil metagenome]
MLCSHHSRSALFATATITLLLAITSSASGQSSGNRVLGIDVSIYQGNFSQTTWNSLQNPNGDNRQFAFIRASRGGTTGVDENQGGYTSPFDATLSRRYDDPNYLRNMTRATAAGMYTGSYHFSRPDIIASTASTNNIANTGTDEANHFIQMAGLFMRPGYLPPVHDLEAGQSARTADGLAQFSLDFSNRIYEVMGIRPAIYINGNYATILGNASNSPVALRDLLAKPSISAPNPAGPAYSQVWTARYPSTIPNVQTAHPDSPPISGIDMYGPWNNYGVNQPWDFWQYSSAAGLVTSYSGALDNNVLQGGMEYLKDQLVPAVWMNDTSGDWSTLLNWNSGQLVVVPVAPSGQLTPLSYDSAFLPTQRLPGAAGTGPTAGSNDTVILDRPNANITVTLSSGTYNIRKLYVRETLNITGGSLTINYVPVAESTLMSAQFSSPVTISGGASLSVHTTYVDPAIDFTAGGNASLTFETLTLFRGATPAKLVLNGNVTITGLAGDTATINTSTVGTSTGIVDLGGAVRTITVTDGAAASDLDIAVPVTNGGLTKAGAGTMVLSSANTYSGTTMVTAGTLSVTGSVNSLSVQVSGGSVGGTLKGTGTINGAVAVTGGTVPGSIRGGASIGTLTLTQALSIGSGGRLIVELGSGNAMAAAVNSGGSTDLVNLPNNQTKNSFIHISAGSVVSGLHTGMLVRIEASAATFAPSTTYSFLVMDGAGAQSFNLNSFNQFSFIGVNVNPASVSLQRLLDGKVYLNFTTAAVPEPAAMLGLGLLALPLLSRRR